jgi:eukaryotic-like serine/threonine-protein kinase
MPEIVSQAEMLESLAEEFLERCRGGQSPSVSEYAARCPELAKEIQELFPTMADMERLKLQRRHARGLRFALGAMQIDRLGDLRIIREIGRGGMGVVYEAEQESLRRRVAVKVLPKHSLMGPDQLSRFQREACIAAQLRHPHIVSVFGVGEHEGLHYYIMQFIQGAGLDKIIARLSPAGPNRAPSAETVSGMAANTTGGAGLDEIVQRLCNGPSVPTTRPSQDAERCAMEIPVPLRLDAFFWKNAAALGLQAARALHYAHSQGTLHCDIKPANLLVDVDGVVWITDFGVAKAMQFETVTRTGDVTGTLQYTAPERFRGQTDARSDIYSLGLSLYELLTLRPAHAGDDRQKLLRSVMDGVPVPPRRVRQDIPRDLETVVLKATARDPACRYQSAADLADDLQRYLDGRPIRARRAGWIERSWRWCDRNRAVAGLTSAVAALLALVAILLTAINASHRASPPTVDRGYADSDRTPAPSRQPLAPPALAGTGCVCEPADTGGTGAQASGPQSLPTGMTCPMGSGMGGMMNGMPPGMEGMGRRGMKSPTTDTAPEH